MTEPAINVDNVTFAYGDLEAVKGVSFEVAPGDRLLVKTPGGGGWGAP